MAKTVKTKVLLRNDTAAKWTSNNPVLGKGEIGIEIDTRKFKFGDGTKTWTQLPYASARDVSFDFTNLKLVKDDGTIDVVKFVAGDNISLTPNSTNSTVTIGVTGLDASDLDLSALVDTMTGTPGTGKTVTAFDEANGKVSITFSDISITESQISDLQKYLTGVSYDATAHELKITNKDGTTSVHKFAAIADSGAAADVRTAGYTTTGGTTIAASTVQAELQRLSNSVENAVAGSGEVNVIEGVKLEGADAVLPLSSKIATIPNATGTGNGLMSAADKAKLDNIPEDQTTLAAGDGITLTESGTTLTVAVDLSDSNFVDDLHDALAASSIADGETGFTTGDQVQDAIDALKQDLASVFTYKGSKATKAALPTSGNTTGDVWHVDADSSEYVWNGSAWEELGYTVDLSAYLTGVSVAGVDATVANHKATITKANLLNAITDTSVPTGSTSTNVPTTAAVASAIATAGQNYVSAVTAGTNNGYIGVTKNGTTTQVKAYELPTTVLHSTDELIIDCGDSAQEIPSV